MTKAEITKAVPKVSSVRGEERVVSVGDWYWHYDPLDREPIRRLIG